jgi:hypothetical protein
MFSGLLGALIRAPSTGRKQNGNGYIRCEITGVCERKHNAYTCPVSVSTALFVLRVELNKIEKLGKVYDLRPKQVQS